MIRYPTFFLIFALLAAVLLGLSVSATSDRDDYRQERLQELFDLYTCYRAKEDARGDGSTHTSDMLWDEHMTPLTKLTGEDATDRALIDLISARGFAMAPLSWIYHSHGSLHGVEAVNRVYTAERVRILSTSAEDADEFFEGSEEKPPAVYDCYTALLNAIYTEKLRALARPEDSEQVRSILAAAMAPLQDPSTPSDPFLPPPSFTKPADEDGAIYEDYLSRVSALLEQQRHRDALTEQLFAATRTLFPEEASLSPEELAARHGAIRDLLARLPDATTLSQMNPMLQAAVLALIDERAATDTPFVQAYLQGALKAQVTDTVSLASGALPAPKIPDLSTECFGDGFHLSVAIARAKDELVALAHGQTGLTAPLRERLSAILAEYIEKQGYLDRCDRQDAVAAQLSRARLRVTWLCDYGALLENLELTLNKYARPATADTLAERALALYEATDRAIGEGARESENALAADRAQCAALLRDAEILSYETKHPLLSMDPNTVTAQHQAPLAAAIRDALTLSADACSDPLLHRRLLGLGECYKLAVEDAVSRTLFRIEGSGALLRTLNELRANGADTLRKSIASLSVSAADGSPNLQRLITETDRLLAKAQSLHTLLEDCRLRFTAQPPSRYQSVIEALCANAATELLRAETEDEDAILQRATLALDRLVELEEIRAILDAHEGIAGVSTLIGQAEEALLPDATDPPKDLSTLRAALLDGLRGLVRADAAARLQAVLDELMIRRSDYSVDNLSALTTLYENAQSLVQSHPLSGDFADTARLLEAVEKTSDAMREIRLDRVSAANTSQYNGSVSSPDGFTAKTVFSIFSSPHSLKELANAIHAAVKGNMLCRADGVAPANALLGDLLRCRVSAALIVQARNAPTPSHPYTVSIRLPEDVERTALLGVLRMGENGMLTFYEIGGDEDTITFQTDRFAEYYLVSRPSVNLIPWILLLCALILCEGAALLWLYRKKRLSALPSVSLCLISPTMALSVTYTPKGGPVIVGILGLVAIGLGAWIATLLVLEALAVRKRRTRALKPAEERPLIAAACRKAIPIPVPSPSTDPLAEPTEPLPSVSAEEADTLMSDEDADEGRCTDYDDRERYRGTGKAQINLDTISRSFREGEIVHLNSLKEKGLVGRNVGFVKILARGRLDKPLTVVAQDFSTAAIKMILLTGGTPIVTRPSPERERQKK